MQRAKPEDWYRVQRLADELTLIDEPHILPYYRCNIRHRRGRDRDLLVDSGMGAVSLRRWVPLVGEKRLLAAGSHTHFDHIGCHHESSRSVSSMPPRRRSWFNLAGSRPWRPPRRRRDLYPTASRRLHV